MSGARAETERVWRERVAAWRASGETMEQFTSTQSYAAASLRWWSSRLKPVTSARFVRVVPTSVAPRSDLVVEIGAARVRVSSGFDATLLADVVDALTRGAR